MDVQALINALGEQGRRDRSSYHMTLGGLIEELSKMNQDFQLVCSNGMIPGNAHSYRGFYSDLAFEPNGDTETVGEFLAECRAALDNTYTGYKGGEYKMAEDTPLWISSYGVASQIAVMDVSVTDEIAALIVKQID